MLLPARKILLIHFLMRLPDFVRPALDAADRFVQRIQQEKIFRRTVACLTLAARPDTNRRFVQRNRQRMPQRLPRSKTQEG